MLNEKNKPAIKYNPSDKDLKIIAQTYDNLEIMIETCQKGYAEFNQNGEGKDRTLKQFLDDNQKRANSYVPSRASQGKEDWEANVFTPTTRNKVKALIAGIAKQPPEIAIIATNIKNQQSVVRAEFVKLLTESSFTEGEKNPEIDMFFAGWDTAIQGTKIELDDYIRIKNKIKRITNYDPATGEVSFEEIEAYVQDEAVSVNIPLTSFFVWDIYVPNIQDQVRIAWIDYLDETNAEYQFGDFVNFKYVKDGSHHFNDEETKTFFLKKWQERTKKQGKPYEVIRYYEKSSDTYRIIMNGVKFLDAPMLWGKTKKRYPFSKAIFEPFANSKFFWGNSLVNILMAEQDVENAFINSLVDKTYRSLNKPMLIGRVNRDNFDLEDEWVDGDTKIYVEDISQVLPMPIDGVNNAEVEMLSQIQKGMDSDSTDHVQSGASGSGSTAREIVIANERAEELKGLFYTMLKDFWLQKYRIRIINILMNYGQPRILEVIGDDGNKIIEEYYKAFRLPSADLSNGKQGQMEIQIVKDQTQLKRPYSLSVEEEKMNMSGQPTEIIQMTSTFLDGYDYGVRIMTDNLFQKTKSLKMAETTEKIMGAAKLFPQRFMANEEKFFENYMEMYGDSPEKYNAQPQQPEVGIDGMPNLNKPDTPQMGELPKI